MLKPFARHATALFAVLLLSALVPAQAPPAPAQPRPFKIRYRLAMPQPESHLFEVQIEVAGTAGERSVEFQMPRWSPGRYAVFDFAKNVQEVSAMGRCLPEERCGSRDFPVERVDTQTWRVASGGSDEVRLSYKVFADDLSGTFSQLDERHANFNGGSVFMYVAGHKQDDVTLKILAPRGWAVVCGASTTFDQTEFNFPDYDTLIDTPTEVAPGLDLTFFRVGDKSYTVAVHALGERGDRMDDFVGRLERIVRAQIATMGEPDFSGYVFLFHFDPEARRGDGMEHLNSTQIIETGPMADRAFFDAAVSTASHEFFHVWNVKRLRPRGLGPWDYTRPVVTRGLWIAEGFTNYYGRLFERRAGLLDDQELFDSYAGAITEVENAPGNRLTSAVETSLLAPFIDRAVHEQRTNLQNTVVSYYPKGETLAVVIDLLIGARSAGRASLDDVMRRAYEEFYVKAERDSYYLRGRAYELEEFERLASQVAGFDLTDFFRRHAHGVEPPPYEEAFAGVGLRLVRVPGRFNLSALGITPDPKETKRMRVGSVQKGSPAERAGLKAGDTITRAGGEALAEGATWESAFGKYKAGESVLVTAEGASGESRPLTLTLTVGASSRTEFRIEKDDAATPAARALREAWLTGKDRR